MFDLKGIIPPMVTTLDQSGEIVYSDYQRNLERYLELGVEGFLVLGSNGESVYLEHVEKLKLIETARKCVPDSMMLLAGTGLESTKATIQLTQEAADRGVDGVLVKNPFYYKSRMKKDVYIAHFLAVADASPVPVVLYNVPMFTGVSMEASLIIELAKHPNIKGLKESAGNVQLISEVSWATGEEDFSILAGSAPTLFPNMAAGAKGGIVALACAVPILMKKLYEAFVEGDHLLTAKLQRIVAPAAVAVTTKYGIPGLKVAMELEGFASGPPRLPLLPLVSVDQEDLKLVFNTMWTNVSEAELSCRTS